jgi:hypothetical protein
MTKMFGTTYIHVYVYIYIYIYIHLHIHCTTWGNNILKSQWPSILSIQSRESADS